MVNGLFDAVVNSIYLQQPDKRYIDDKLVDDIGLVIKEYIKNHSDTDHVEITALDSIKSAEVSFISMLMNQADMKGFVNFCSKR